MTKRTNIFNELKASLRVLLLVCFAILVYSGTAYADGVPNISPSPTGSSQAFRPQPSAKAGDSSAMSAEYRQIKRAAVNGDLLTYARSTVGDINNAGLDVVDKYYNKGMDAVSKALDSGFSSFENFLGDGLLGDIIANYNPAYQITKAATKYATKAVKFVGNVAIGAAKVVNNVVFGQSNRDCNRERMQQIYKSECYACKVVSSLIGSFMNACTYLYDVSKEAGIKILIIGAMLWIAFYVLQQLSSLKNVEPTAMVTEMLVMAFKILGAFLVIGAGIEFFINYAIIPFLNFGAEFGIAMLASASVASGIDISTYSAAAGGAAGAGGPIPASFINNLMTYVQAVDSTVSTHMQIGHMVTCHATHVGAYDWTIARIPNIWIWISGAFIWFCGFMMTLSVAYYLVDISFKLGFAIIALPVMVGLWPFNITKGKLASCFSIILKSMGIFIFLAMTVAAGLALVSNALDVGSGIAMGESIDSILTKEMTGTEKIMIAVEDGDSEYIDSQLAFWNFGWIIILFAYLFAIKLIGSTMSDYVDKFFPDQMMGSGSPMHSHLTQATDFVKKKAMKPVKFAGKVAKQSAKGGIDKVAGNMFGGGKSKGPLDKAGDVKDGVDKLTKGEINGEGDDSNKKKSSMENAKSMANMDSDKDKKAMNKQSSNSGAGGAMEKSGQAMKQGGQQMQQAADSIDQNLAAVDQSVQATGNSTNAALHSMGAAAAVPTLGVGTAAAEAGVAANTAATQSASMALKAGRMAAKAMKMMGKAMEKGGETIEKAGKGMKKVEKVAGKLKQAGKSVNKFADKIGKNVDSASGKNQEQEKGQQQPNQNDDLINSMAKGAANGASGKKK